MAMAMDTDMDVHRPSWRTETEGLPLCTNAAGARHLEAAAEVTRAFVWRGAIFGLP